MNHELKSWPDLFVQFLAGRKTHDLRKADRSFAVGDTLTLREYDPKVGTYTGRLAKASITYITSEGCPCAEYGRGLAPGFVILSIKQVAS